MQLRCCRINHCPMCVCARFEWGRLWSDTSKWQFYLSVFLTVFNRIDFSRNLIMIRVSIFSALSSFTCRKSEFKCRINLQPNSWHGEDRNSSLTFWTKGMTINFGRFPPLNKQITRHTSGKVFLLYPHSDVRVEAIFASLSVGSKIWRARRIKTISIRVLMYTLLM